MRYLADFFVENPAEVIDVGQTLYCKIVEKNDEEQKVAVATRVKEVGAVVEDSVKVMAGWLEEVRRVKNWTGKLHVGSLVSATVKTMTEFGVLVEVEGVEGVEGIEGVVTTTQMGGQTVVLGQRLACVVLYVDHGAKCLELSSDPALVSRITTTTGETDTSAAIDSCNLPM